MSPQTWNASATLSSSSNTNPASLRARPSLEPLMIHPRILSHYLFNRTECQACPVDACADCAHYWGVHVRTLSAFLRAVGIDADHLRNI